MAILGRSVKLNTQHLTEQTPQLINPVFPKVVDREDSFQTLFQSILVRAKATVAVGDKRQNPISAICSAPGGGKSRFVDEVAALFGDMTKRTTHFEQARIGKENMIGLGPFFDSLVPISITYSSDSPYLDEYDAEYGTGTVSDAPAGFALRILFQFVVFKPTQLIPQWIF